MKNVVRGLLRLILAKNPLLKVPFHRLAHSGILPSCIWKRLPVEGTFRVMLPDGHSFMYSAIANDKIARALFWRGLKSWECETISIFTKLARKANLVVDVGANTGVYTMLACVANSQAHVVAFEPVPKVYQKLVEHIKLNGWEGRCQARNEAVSNSIGTIKMRVPFGDMPTSASIRIEGYRTRGDKLIDVPVTTLDTYFGNRPVDLVKIDVEGSEDKVLEGMQHVLATWSPSLIIECNPDGHFQSIQDILEGFGYRFYHLRKGGPINVDRIIPHGQKEERNFLCVSRTKKIEAGL
jgi:FkbM family methyltransferase